MQVGGAQRVLFDTDKMQPCTGHRVLFEQLPGTEKIQPGAEPGLANHQSTIHRQCGETVTQIVLLQKHVASFFKARLVGKIHIIEHPRARATLVVPVELGVGQYRFHGRLGNGKEAILADRRSGA